MFSRKAFCGLSKLWVLGLVLLNGCASVSKSTASKVQITEMSDRLRVEIGGKLFTEYYFINVPRPFCYPIIGPGDSPMTRNWPIKTVGQEEEDHPHHRSLWFTHGSVNGVDFWSESKSAGKQVHQKFLKVESGKTGIIQSQNKWISVGGKEICEDERTLRIYDSASSIILDFEISLKATQGDLVLGDTKEGTMAIRLAETMRLKPNKFNTGKPTGHIVQSTGVRDEQTWGKQAEWCDYSGLVNGKLVGVAIFDHPKNPRYPTWWHVRDYGLFAANPFGVHDFEQKPKGVGDFSIKAGQSATFRYRFVFHEGDEKQGTIATLYKNYVDGH